MECFWSNFLIDFKFYWVTLFKKLLKIKRNSSKLNKTIQMKKQVRKCRKIFRDAKKCEIMSRKWSKRFKHDLIFTINLYPITTVKTTHLNKIITHLIYSKSLHTTTCNNTNKTFNFAVQRPQKNSTKILFTEFYQHKKKSRNFKLI